MIETPVEDRWGYSDLDPKQSDQVHWFNTTLSLPRGTSPMFVLNTSACGTVAQKRDSPVRPFLAWKWRVVCTGCQRMWDQREPAAPEPVAEPADPDQWGYSGANPRPEQKVHWFGSGNKGGLGTLSACDNCYLTTGSVYTLGYWTAYDKCAKCVKMWYRRSDPVFRPQPGDTVLDDTWGLSTTEPGSSRQLHWYKIISDRWEGTVSACWNAFIQEGDMVAPLEEWGHDSGWPLCNACRTLWLHRFTDTRNDMALSYSGNTRTASDTPQDPVALLREIQKCNPSYRVTGPVPRESLIGQLLAMGLVSYTSQCKPTCWDAHCPEPETHVRSFTLTFTGKSCLENVIEKDPRG
jgi:hypothetical protein